MLSDLEGFIERRAADLARPLMEDAERAITSAGRRVADLQAESGRLTRSLERQLAGTKAELAAVTANCVRLLAELRRKLDELAVARRERDAAKAESRHNAEIAASALDRLRAEAPAE
jgi:phage host-nuclease inhibitor protein Gam